MKSKLSAHPLSELFPLMDGQSFSELKADIKANGQQEPILLYGGKILDGRNRYQACTDLGLDPETREFKGTEAEARAYVVSLNLHRRHLSESQRALIAGKLADSENGGCKSRVQICTLENAAKQLNVSRRSAASGRKVARQGSAPLRKAVESGEISISKAASVVDKPKAEQLAAARTEAPSKEEPESVGVDIVMLGKTWCKENRGRGYDGETVKAFCYWVQKVLSGDLPMPASALGE